MTSRPGIYPEAGLIWRLALGGGLTASRIGPSRRRPGGAMPGRPCRIRYPGPTGTMRRPGCGRRPGIRPWPHGRRRTSRRPGTRSTWPPGTCCCSSTTCRCRGCCRWSSAGPTGPRGGRAGGSAVLGVDLRSAAAGRAGAGYRRIRGRAGPVLAVRRGADGPVPLPGLPVAGPSGGWSAPVTARSWSPTRRPGWSGGSRAAAASCRWSGDRPARRPGPLRATPRR